MKRTLFSEEHDAFRVSFRTFVDREIRPHQARFRDAGRVDRELWRKAGAAGFLCPWLATDQGGPGGDWLCSVVIMEELARAYESGFAMALHSDVCVPYLASFGDAAQQARWLPGCASGELVTAIAMTEPGTGSDLAAIATTARRDGDDDVIDGAKTFISNGQLCDLVIVAAKTDPDPANAHRGISLFVVEATRPGFGRGKQLEKMGMASQDTSEMFFESCRVRRRRSTNSASSVAVSGPVPTGCMLAVRSARACTTHSANADGVKSRLRATSLTLRPCSSTSRTASALNSAENDRRGRGGVRGFLDIGDTVFS